MAKRPALTDTSFLQYIFSPKKHGLPTGLRRSKLTSAAGRNKTRLKSYNKMSAANQEVLRRSGKRDSYLKGEVSFVEAKRALRDVAVDLGVAKPLRTRAPRQTSAIDSMTHAEKRKFSDLNRIAGRYVQTIREAGKQADLARVMYNMQFMPLEVRYAASRMDYSQIKEASTDPDNTVKLPDGSEYNPFWYH